MNPEAVIMVRPRHFGYNPETAESNAFQKNVSIDDASQLALEEFNQMVALLRENGVEVLVYNDPDDPVCTDAVFPNNWFAIFPSGIVVLFPMMVDSRRKEVNLVMIDELRKKYGLGDVIDYTARADQDVYLEGTGSIIFDHDQRLAYACVSPRTNISLLSELCRKINYRPVSFEATDSKGQQIYHTNVLMSVGEKRVIICLDAIDNTIERGMVQGQIRKSGKEILDISFGQLRAFAGNALQVKARDGSRWVLSRTAWDSLRDQQRRTLESDGGVCIVDIPVIEQLGGGSARCMMAGLYLS